MQPPVDHIEHLAAEWHAAAQRLAPGFGIDPLPPWTQMSIEYRRWCKATVGLLVNEHTVEVNWWRG